MTIQILYVENMNKDARENLILLGLIALAFGAYFAVDLYDGKLDAQLDLSK